MMRCPRFRYASPSTVREACRLLGDAGGEAMILAGGTDLVPNMKRRQQVPATLVSLRRIEALHGLKTTKGEARIGAMTTLSALVAHPELRERYPALFKAAGQVATPHLRNMGTLGGNLCVDTRCNYYDQSHEWRQSIDFCMKKDGKICWVAPGSPRCWAVSSTDTAPALMALGARVLLAGEGGQRDIALPDFYRDDGIDYLSRRRGEILTDILMPAAVPGEASTYWKLRRRGSFDFPVLSVAAWIRRDGDGIVTDARIVLGSVASRPLIAPAARLLGSALGPDAIDEAAEEASALAKPLDNTDFTLGWRKKSARHLIAGALRELGGEDPRSLGTIARRAAELVPV